MINQAYQKSILPIIQDNLGAFFDITINTLDYSYLEATNLFINSRISPQIEIGNRTYTTGMSGLELVKVASYELFNHELSHVSYSKISKEYWAGFVLAYLQWATSKSFEEILGKLPLEEIVNKYNPYHETSEEKFVVDMLEHYFTESNLRLFRKRNTYSQKKLSELSSVPLRTIRTYEQNPESINNGKVTYIYKLSQVLHCKVKDLLY